MVFMKNPVKGKVKTRLAKTVGDDKALEIYEMLLEYTESIAAPLKNCEKAIFYSDNIDANDLWKENNNCQKYIQDGNDLGERMKNAFDFAFKNKYEKVVIIGTDCHELKTEILESAFTFLDCNDVVIGPATDGGYYLLGMKSVHKELFENMQWSTENVLLDTIKAIQNLNLHYHLLPALTDLDTEENFIEMKKMKL